MLPVSYLVTSLTRLAPGEWGRSAAHSLAREVSIVDDAARETEMDFGPRNGTARVTVRDPCVSAAARLRRQEVLSARCAELLRQGLLRTDDPKREKAEDAV